MVQGSAPDAATSDVGAKSPKLSDLQSAMEETHFHPYSGKTREDSESIVKKLISQFEQVQETNTGRVVKPSLTCTPQPKQVCGVKVLVHRFESFKAASNNSQMEVKKEHFQDMDQKLHSIQIDGLVALQDQAHETLDPVDPWKVSPRAAMKFLQSTESLFVQLDERDHYESLKLDCSDPDTELSDKGRLQYIFEEIKSTERNYVAELNKGMLTYKACLKDLKVPAMNEAFDAVERIYKGHLIFLNALETWNIDINSAVELFINFEDLFSLYPAYLENLPKAQRVIAIFQGNKENVASYLMMPFARLGNYKLFLEGIIKQLGKEHRPKQHATAALKMVEKYMSQGNDAVATASILDNPLNVKSHGPLILRDKLVMLKPKKCEVMVFLFKNVLIFTTEDPHHRDQYRFIHSIYRRSLALGTFNDQTNTIEVTDFDKNKNRNSDFHTYVLDLGNLDLKLTWTDQIEKILWDQMRALKEIAAFNAQYVKDFVTIST